MNTFKYSLSEAAISIVELIVGILLLIDPVGFTSAIITAFGVILMICGFINAVKYFRADPEEAALRQFLAKGLAELLAGMFFAVCSGWFVATFPVLTLLYGVVILFAGLSKVQWTADMIRMKRKRWLPSMIGAAVSVLCGFVIITSPFRSTAALWMFTGISLIAEAVFDLLAAFLTGRQKER